MKTLLALVLLMCGLVADTATAQVCVGGVCSRPASNGVVRSATSTVVQRMSLRSRPRLLRRCRGCS